MTERNNQQNCDYPGDCALTEFWRKRAESRKDVAIPEHWQTLVPKAKEIKLLLLDVDGVLTDGSLHYYSGGEEMKVFNCRDGFGMNLVRKAGVEVGIITARNSEAMARRAADLKVAHLYQGCRNKVQAYRQILAKNGIKPIETAYMGDDWLDLGLLSHVGFSATVADADPEVCMRVDFVSGKRGGRGAVREVCDLLVYARGMREKLLNEYLTRQ